MRGANKDRIWEFILQSLPEDSRYDLAVHVTSSAANVFAEGLNVYLTNDIADRAGAKLCAQKPKKRRSASRRVLSALPP